MSPPPVHYIWAGPPPKAPGKLAGMDVLAAGLLAARCPDREISFWCLNEHVEYYKGHFSTAEVNVQVKSIEDYLNEHDAKLLSYIEWLKEQVPTDGKPLTPDDRRYLVTIKALVQYYLPTCEEGYFLDSTVMPLSKCLPKRILPRLEDVDFTYSTVDGQVDDPWMQYCCAKTDEERARARLRFEAFQKEVESILSKGEPGDNKGGLDRPALGEAFVAAVAAGQLPEMSYMHLEARKVNPESNCYEVRDVGVSKIYLNSHKLGVLAGDVNQMAVYLTLGGVTDGAAFEHLVKLKILSKTDINSLIHMAISKSNLVALRVFLKNPEINFKNILKDPLINAACRQAIMMEQLSRVASKQTSSSNGSLYPFQSQYCSLINSDDWQRLTEDPELAAAIFSLDCQDDKIFANKNNWQMLLEDDNLQEAVIALNNKKLLTPKHWERINENTLLQTAYVKLVEAINDDNQEAMCSFFNHPDMTMQEHLSEVKKHFPKVFDECMVGIGKNHIEEMEWAPDKNRFTQNFFTELKQLGPETIAAVAGPCIALAIEQNANEIVRRIFSNLKELDSEAEGLSAIITSVVETVKSKLHAALKSSRNGGIIALLQGLESLSTLGFDKVEEVRRHVIDVVIEILQGAVNKVEDLNISNFFGWLQQWERERPSDYNKILQSIVEAFKRELIEELREHGEIDSPISKILQKLQQSAEREESDTDSPISKILQELQQSAKRGDGDIESPIISQGVFGSGARLWEASEENVPAAESKENKPAAASLSHCTIL